MTIRELILALSEQDLSAPVHLYDPNHDVSIEVSGLALEDPRVDRTERLHRHTVWLETA